MIRRSKVWRGLLPPAIFALSLLAFLPLALGVFCVAGCSSGSARRQLVHFSPYQWQRGGQRGGDGRFSQPVYAPVPEAGPVRAYQQRLDRAAAGLGRRRQALVQGFLQDLNQHGLGDFSKKPRLSSLRRIAAGLFALKRQRRQARMNPSAPPLYHPAVPEDFPQQVEAFTRTIRRRAVAGTSRGILTRAGDYDFFMKEMVSLLYLFKHDRDLLTDQAAFNIVDRGLSHYLGQRGYRSLTFRVGVPIFSVLLEYPETENHVLMTYSSIYLGNQWVAQNPRHDSRLRRGRYRKLRRFKNAGGKVEDRVLQACGRVLHNGFWEVNSRPYQAMTAHALMNLQGFAAARPVRTAARNALDYLSAKFAFQSLQMRRFAPYRRQIENADSTDLYANDGVPFMMGVLHGGHAWPDDFYGTGHAAGHALWASLLPYRAPQAVVEFMLNKHTGFWARMQTRYSAEHYRAGEAGKYFGSDGRAFLSKQSLQSLPELYFVTPRFINAAGGSYRRYRIAGDTFVGKNNVQDLDFLSRPHALIPRGHMARWKNIRAMARQVMLMKGERRHWMSDNGGTYKSFSYGYFHHGRRDRHLDFPMRLPPAWRKHLFRQSGLIRFSTKPKSRASFSFIDLSGVKRYGFYLVLGKVGKSENHPGYRHFARGFWEIVPGRRFASVAQLKDHVIAHNPGAAFSNATRGPKRYFRYALTSGETVELDDLLGHHDGSCRNPIRNIWPAGADPNNDPPLDLARVTFDRCNRRAIARMPLLLVREVNDDYAFTGRVFALAPGDGRVWVNNPFLRARLYLDSRDYRRPTRREERF